MMHVAMNRTSLLAQPALDLPSPNSVETDDGLVVILAGSELCDTKELALADERPPSSPTPVSLFCRLLTVRTCLCRALPLVTSRSFLP